jgi:hypothetical protein
MFIQKKPGIPYIVSVMRNEKGRTISDPALKS